MNPNDEAKPVQTEGGQPSDDNHIEVLVEDLFIEEYPTPTVEQAAEEKHGRLARAVSPLKGRGKGLLYYAFLAVGLVVGSLAAVERYRRTSRISRLFHRLGLSS